MENQNKERMKIQAYSQKGNHLLEKLVEKGQEWTDYKIAAEPYGFQSKWKLDEEEFHNYSVWIFIGSTGIAVRKIADCLKGKDKDPAVLVMDELGMHVIALLSGHLGGANEWCMKVARAVGAKPVITTASDIEGFFSVDLFARHNGYVIEKKEEILPIAKASLENQNIGLFIEGEEGTQFSPILMEGNYHYNRLNRCQLRVLEDKDALGHVEENFGIHVLNTGKEGKIFQQECRLRRKNIVVGIGCKKGKSKDEIWDFLEDLLEEEQLLASQIRAITSIDVKKDETGILELAQMLKVPFFTGTKEELDAVEGDFTESPFVSEKVGVGNVCERSAMCYVKKQGFLIRKKTVRNGITIAFAKIRTKESILYY